MKNNVLLILILLVILVTACQGGTPQTTVTPVPTVAPTDMPTEETAPEPTEAGADTESAIEEAPTEEAAEVGDTTSGSMDEQLELLAALAPPPQLSDREPGIQIVPCLPGTSLGFGEVEGEDYYCGVFTVSQNWDEPDGRNLDLAFVVAKATGENPEPDPVLFLAGGPGQSAVFIPSVDRYRELRPDRDIILFDIRGIGASQRLGFEECLVLALQNGAPAEQLEALQEAAPGLLAAASGEQEIPPSPAIWDLDLPPLNQACWEQFSAQGLDLNQFTTASNARDAVELVKALGYESFDLHGVSYGTRLAMTIMDNIPGYNDAPELRSVVLDSTFPPSVYLVRTIVRSDHDFMLQLMKECQEDAACNEAYPDLSARLAELLKGVEEAPLTVNGETVTLDDVVDQLTNVGGTRAAYLPKMIAELEAGVLDTYLALRDGEVGTESAESSPGLDLDPSDPVQAFLADASALISDEGAAAEFIAYASFGLLEDDPLAALQAIIEESYPGETGDQMLELLGRLTAEDIAASPYVAQQLALAMASMEESPEEALVRLRTGLAGQTAPLLFTLIHCADDILNESFEDAQNSYNNLQFPQLTNLDKSRVQASRCESWPISAAPIEVKDPVTSDVPALILQGAYDMPTPVYMGQTANSELENSTYVLIPQQGHATWNNASNCVGQIATAFVQDPEAELDLSCLDARWPQWALPDDGEK
jgi:pimeloyl-ACP methyl ester carboxylesterase